jgi:hypothetical protein
MIDIESKLTEDETVELLIKFLKSDSYYVKNYI